MKFRIFAAFCAVLMMSSAVAAELTRSVELSGDEKSAVFAVPNGFSFTRAFACDAQGGSVPVSVGEPTTMNHVTLIPIALPETSQTSQTSLTVVFTDNGPLFTGRPAKVMRQAIKEKVANPEDVPTTQYVAPTRSRLKLAAAPQSLDDEPSAQQIDGADVLILSPHDNVTLWEKYKTFRESTTADRNLTFKVVDLNTLYADAQGNKTWNPAATDGTPRNPAEVIHKYLRTNRDSLGVSYVILGGSWINAQKLDANGTWLTDSGAKIYFIDGNEMSLTNSVPGIIAHPRHDVYLPSDMYYACLDMTETTGNPYPWIVGNSNVYYDDLSDDSKASLYDSGVDLAVTRIPLKPVITGSDANGDKKQWTPAQLMDAIIAKVKRAEGIAEDRNFTGTGRVGSHWNQVGGSAKKVDGTMTCEYEFYDDTVNLFEKDLTTRPNEKYNDAEFAQRQVVRDHIAKYYPVRAVDSLSGEVWSRGFNTRAEAVSAYFATDRDYSGIDSHGGPGGACDLTTGNLLAATGITLFNDVSVPCQTGWQDSTSGGGGYGLANKTVGVHCAGEAAVDAPFGGAIASVNNSRSGWTGPLGSNSLSYLLYHAGARAFLERGKDAGETWIDAHLTYVGVNTPGSVFKTIGNTSGWCLAEHTLFGDPLIKSKAVVDYTTAQGIFPEAAVNAKFASAVAVSGTNAVVNATAASSVAFSRANGATSSRMKILQTLTVSGSNASVTVGEGLEGGIGKVVFSDATNRGTLTINATGRFYVGAVENAAEIRICGNNVILDCDNLVNVGKIVFVMDAQSSNVLRGIRTAALSNIPVEVAGGTLILETRNIFGGPEHSTVTLSNGAVVKCGVDPKTGYLFMNGEPMNAQFVRKTGDTSVCKVFYNYGTDLIKTWQVADGVTKESIGTELPIAFQYNGYIGNQPIGWFSAWDGTPFAENEGILSPGGFVHEVAEPGHYPYVALPQKRGVTIALYADLTDLDSHGESVMLSLGDNVLLTCNEKNTIKLFVNNTASDSVDYPGDGYHLYVVEYLQDEGSETTGKLKLFIDGVEKLRNIAGKPNVGLRVGCKYGNENAAYSKAIGMTLGTILGYDAILKEAELTALKSQYPAIGNGVMPVPTSLNLSIPDNNSVLGVLKTATFFPGKYLGADGGRLFSPAGTTVKVPALRFNNHSQAGYHVTLDVFGTIELTAANDSPHVYYNQYLGLEAETPDSTKVSGILQGHLGGSSAVTVYHGGQILAPESYWQIGHKATGDQLLTIDGGYVKTLGLSNYSPSEEESITPNTHGSVTIKNGGVLEVADWPVKSASELGLINLRLEDGTLKAYGDWICPFPLSCVTGVSESTVIDCAGHHIVFSGEVSGRGNLTLKDSVGSGSIIFLGDISAYGGVITKEGAVSVDFGESAANNWTLRPGMTWNAANSWADMNGNYHTAPGGASVNYIINAAQHTQPIVVMGDVNIVGIANDGFTAVVSSISNCSTIDASGLVGDLFIETEKNVTIDRGNNPLHITKGVISSEISPVVIGTGDLYLDGGTNPTYGLSMICDTPSGSTLHIVGGKVKANVSNQMKIVGNVVVEPGATFINTTTDAIHYGANQNIDVYGTLDMASTRWTIQSGNHLTFYAGSSARGYGNPANRAIDLYQDGNVINFKKNAFARSVAEGGEIDYQLHTCLRDADATFVLEDGVALNLNQADNGAGYVISQIGSRMLTKKGAGKLILDATAKIGASLNIAEGAFEYRGGQVTDTLTFSESVVWFLSANTKTITFNVGTLAAPTSPVETFAFVGDVLKVVRLTYNTSAKTMTWAEVDSPEHILNWKGGASGNWNDENNWSPKRVPALGDKVYFGTATTVDLSGAVIPQNVVISSIDQISSLTIKNAQCLPSLDCLNVENCTSLTLEFDLTNGDTLSEAQKTNLMSAIKAAGDNVTFRFKGEGENGLSLDFGEQYFTLGSHLIFDGGSHVYKHKNGNSGGVYAFAVNGTYEAPTFRVTNGAALDFHSKDASGWNSPFSPEGVIRVDDGSALIVHANNSSQTSFCYGQRLYLEPGSTLTFTGFDAKYMRLNGGAPDGYSQIFVPSANSGNYSSDTAIINAPGGNGISTGKADQYPGFAVDVGVGSRLKIIGNVIVGFNGVVNTLTKRGEGDIEMTAASTCDVVVEEGNLALTATTAAAPNILGNVTIKEGAGIAFPAGWEMGAHYPVCSGVLIAYPVKNYPVHVGNVEVTADLNYFGKKASYTVDYVALAIPQLSDRVEFVSVTDDGGQTIELADDGVYHVDPRTPVWVNYSVDNDAEASIPFLAMLPGVYEAPVPCAKVGTVCYDSVATAYAFNPGEEITLVDDDLLDVEIALNEPLTLKVEEGRNYALRSKLTGDHPVHKTGLGRLVFAAANTYTGGFYLDEGSAATKDGSSTFCNAVNGDVALANQSTITAAAGTILDISHVNGYSYKIVTAGTLTGSVDIGNNSRQTESIALAGDATISGSANFGLLANGYRRSYLDLGGYTLTIEKDSADKNFWFVSTEATGYGTLYVKKGILGCAGASNSGNDVLIASGTLRIGAAGKLNMGNKNLTVRNFVLENGGSVTASSTTDKYLKVTGLLDLSSSLTDANVKLKLTPTTVIKFPEGLEAGDAYTLCAGGLALDGITDNTVSVDAIVKGERQRVTLTYNPTNKTVSYALPSEPVYVAQRENGAKFTSLSAAITASGDAESTITLLNTSFEDVEIPSNVTIVGLSSTIDLVGNVRGTGKIVLKNVLPSVVLQSSLQNSDYWRGKVHLKNYYWTSFDFAQLGNANSVVALTGVSGYSPWSDTACFDGTLELIDENTTKALTINNAYNSTYTVRKLVGEGTFMTAIRHDAQAKYVFEDVTGFSGTFDQSSGMNKSVTIGSAAGGDTGLAVSGNIRIRSGATLSADNPLTISLAAQKTLTFGGTLVVSDVTDTNRIVLKGVPDGTTLPTVVTDANGGMYASSLESGNLVVTPIEVAQVGSDTYTTVAEAITAVGEIPNATIVLLNVSSENITIPANVTLNMGDKAFSGAVSGEGTIIISKSIRHDDNNTNLASTFVTSLQNTETWHGAVVLKGCYEHVNLSSIMTLGNSNSRIVSKGNKGWFGQETLAERPLWLEDDGETPALYVSNSSGGWGYNVKIAGDGTLMVNSNAGSNALIRLIDTSDFTGKLEVTNLRVEIGAGGSVAYNDGKIVVKSGNTLKMDEGKYWRAAGGIEVSGTIGGAGTIKSAINFKDNATIDLTSGALTCEGIATFSTSWTLKVTGAAETGSKLMSFTTLPTARPGRVLFNNATDTGYIYVIGNDWYVAKTGVVSATYGGANYPTILAALQAAEAAGDAPTAVTVTNDATTLPEGYEDYIVSADGTIIEKPQTVIITIPSVENATYVVTVNDETRTVENGSITVNYGDRVVVTYSAAEGYIMADVTKTIESVTTDSSIDDTGIRPVRKTFTVNIPDYTGANVVVTVNDVATVPNEGVVVADYADTVKLSFSAATGYVVEGDYVEQTFTYASNPAVVQPTIVKIHAVSKSLDTHVESTTIPESVRADNNRISFTVTPSTGYHVVSVKVGETDVPFVTDHYEWDVTADTTIAVTTAINTYTVTITGLGNGIYAAVAGFDTLTSNGSVTFEYGRMVPISYYVDGPYVLSRTFDLIDSLEEDVRIVAPTKIPAVAMVYSGYGPRYFGTLADAVANADMIDILADIDAESVTLPDNRIFNVTSDFTCSAIISGAHSLTKRGAGTLTMSGASTYVGTTTISAGTLKMGNFAALGATGNTVVVNSGATLDINDQKGGLTFYTAELRGGTLKNSGTSAWTVNNTFPITQINLTANSSIDSTGHVSLINSGHGGTGINLGTYTLTKRGSRYLTLCNTVVNGNGGKLVVEEGAMVVEVSGAMINAGAALEIGNVATLTIDKGKALTVKGTLIPGGTINGAGTLAFADNSKIALASRPENGAKILTSSDSKMTLTLGSNVAISINGVVDPEFYTELSGLSVIAKLYAAKKGDVYFKTIDAAIADSAQGDIVWISGEIPSGYFKDLNGLVKKEIATVDGTPYASLTNAKSACTGGNTIVIVSDLTGLANFAKASDYSNVGAIEIAEGVTVSGHFPENARTIPLIINGTFEITNGYSDESQAATIPTLSGTGKITKTWRRDHLIYVEEYSGWNPSATSPTCVKLSLAKSSNAYFYDSEAIKTALCSGTVVTNIGYTNATVPAGIVINGDKLVLATYTISIADLGDGISATINGNAVSSLVVEHGTSVTITYSVEGAYVLSKTSDLIDSVTADTTIVAPTKTTAVAQVGYVYYSDIRTAINAANFSLWNCCASDLIVVSNDVTIPDDMTNEYAFARYNNGNLTIRKKSSYFLYLDADKVVDDVYALNGDLEGYVYVDWNRDLWTKFLPGESISYCPTSYATTARIKVGPNLKCSGFGVQTSTDITFIGLPTVGDEKIFDHVDVAPDVGCKITFKSGDCPFNLGSLTANSTECVVFRQGDDGYPITIDKFTSGSSVIIADGSAVTIKELDSGITLQPETAAYEIVQDGTTYTSRKRTYKVKVPTVTNATVSHAGYTADEDGYITVNHGDTVTFVFTPDAEHGYEFVGENVTDRIVVGPVISAIESVGSSSITVPTLKQYTVMIAQVANATYTVDGDASTVASITVDWGSSHTVVYTAAEGYEFTDGTTAKEFALADIRDNATVGSGLETSKKRYTVSITGLGDGISATINGNAVSSLVVEHGTSVTITYSVEGAYVLSKTSEETFTATSKREFTAPTKTAAVAKIGSIYYATLKDAVESGAAEIDIIANIDSENVALTKNLTLNVGRNYTFAAVLSGDCTLTKTGAGTLSISAAQTLTGDFIVAEGKVEASAAVRAKDANAYVEVRSGANLTLTDGVQTDSQYKFKLAGDGVGHEGALVLTSAVSWYSAQAKAIELTADATVTADWTGEGGTGLVGSRYAETAIELNGHVLTKKGSKPFLLLNTTVNDTVGGGKIVIAEGTVETVNTDYTTTFNVPVDGRLNVQSPIVVNVPANQSCTITQGGLNSSVSRTATLADGATLIATEGLFAEGDVTTEVAGYYVDSITANQLTTFSLAEITNEMTASEINTKGTFHVNANATLTVDADITGSPSIVNEGSSPVTVTLKPSGDKRYVSAADVHKLQLGENISLAYDWQPGKVISINFDSGRGSMTGDDIDMTFAGKVPRSSWVNTTGGTDTNVAVGRLWDSDAEATQTINGMTIGYSSLGTYGPKVTATLPFMKGYLDLANYANQSVTLDLAGIPFKKCDLIVYFQTDNSNGFRPVTITHNYGATTETFGYDSDKTIVKSGYSDPWGGGNQADISYQQNVMRIDGLVGSVLHIVTLPSATYRTSVAAIQIVENTEGIVTYRRNPDAASNDWMVDGGWLDPAGNAVKWRNPNLASGQIYTAEIDADQVSEIKLTSQVFASAVIVKNSAKTYSEGAKSFKFLTSESLSTLLDDNPDAPILDAPVDTVGFCGDLYLQSRISGALSLGQGAHITFVAMEEGVETTAYPYTFVGTMAPIRKIGPGIFLVPESMYSAPFNVTEGLIRYDYSGTDAKTVSGALSGSGKLVKTGTGELVFSSNGTISGGTTIEAGTIKLGANQALGGQGANVLVKSGAALDVNGKENHGINLTLAGGTLKNTSASNAALGQVHFRSMTLTADSVLDLTGRTGILNNGWNAANLNLNGYTLTKRGAGEFLLCNTTVSSGTIRFEAGGLRLSGSNAAYSSGASNLSAADFVIAGTGITFAGFNPTVKSLTFEGDGSIAAADDHDAQITSLRETSLLYCFHLNGNQYNSAIKGMTDVTIEGTPTWSDSSKFGGEGNKSYTANGSDKAIVVANSSGIATGETGWTISMWIQPNDLGNWRDIVGFTIGSVGYRIEKSGGNALRIYNNQSSSKIYDVDLVTYSDKTDWVHLAIVPNADGKSFDVYGNGVYKKTYATDSTEKFIWGSSDVHGLTKVSIGQKGIYELNGSGSWDGNLDEVAIFNTNLNPVQIAYLAENKPSEEVFAHTEPTPLGTKVIGLNDPDRCVWALAPAPKTITSKVGALYDKVNITLLVNLNDQTPPQFLSANTSKADGSSSHSLDLKWEDSLVKLGYDKDHYTTPTTEIKHGLHLITMSISWKGGISVCLDGSSTVYTSNPGIMWTSSGNEHKPTGTFTYQGDIKSITLDFSSTPVSGLNALPKFTQKGTAVKDLATISEILEMTGKSIGDDAFEGTGPNKTVAADVTMGSFVETGDADTIGITVGTSLDLPNGEVTILVEDPEVKGKFVDLSTVDPLVGPTADPTLHDAGNKLVVPINSLLNNGAKSRLFKIQAKPKQK